MSADGMTIAVDACGNDDAGQRSVHVRVHVLPLKTSGMILAML